MEYRLQHGALSKIRTSCLVLGIYAQRKLGQMAKEADQLSGGRLSALLKESNLNKAGDTLLLHDLPGVAAKKLLMVCLGEKKEYSATAYQTAIAAAVGAMQTQRGSDLTLALHLETCADQPPVQMAREAIVACANTLYRFDQLKSVETLKKQGANQPLKRIQLLASDKTIEAALSQGMEQGMAIAKGMQQVKDLANLPGNLCTPSHLAEQAKALSKEYASIQTQVLEEKEMAKLGMGALLSVSRGSRQPAKLIVMEHRGTQVAKDTPPIILVGKGLTFDAGGISLKPAAGMDEMKYDMCGGASVIGALRAVAELNLPIRLIGLVPSSENLPDGEANKPGDIVTSLSGQTIEVLNTDAEGRLILCDALTYAERFKPALVIDIATLTGACIIALGDKASGLLANDQTLADELLAAGQTSHDRAWQLPLWPEYQKQLESPFADMANIGGKGAGTITAACFLSRFTEKYPWAHLDIAGTAWRSGDNKGATGRPLPLLMQFLLHRAAQDSAS